MKPKPVFTACIVLCLLLGAAAGAMLYTGVYNVSALQQHTGIVFEMLEYTRVRSIAVRSPREVPDLNASDWQQSGVALYSRHCQQCHGAPGVAPEPFALGMLPAPSPIVKVARIRPPEEIYWAITHGVKMSGMPAWEYRLSEDQRWAIVALISRLPAMTPQDYAELQRAEDVEAAMEAEPVAAYRLADRATRLRRGRIALQQYNCAGCHEIPGITAAEAHVGPPLEGLAAQVFIAGLLPMNAHNLKQWIMLPQTLKPGTAMPNMGVSDSHAEWMVEYLLSETVNP